jgi:hypothetical protein
VDMVDSLAVVQNQAAAARITSVIMEITVT